MRAHITQRFHGNQATYDSRAFSLIVVDTFQRTRLQYNVSWLTVFIFLQQTEVRIVNIIMLHNNAIQRHTLFNRGHCSTLVSPPLPASIPGAKSTLLATIYARPESKCSDMTSDLVCNAISVSPMASSSIRSQPFSSHSIVVNHYYRQHNKT